MYTVAVTRFDDRTWQENCAFREKHGLSGCVYGSPAVIAGGIPSGASVFVLEMNNTKRRIEGIGLVSNRLHPRRARIYWDNFYNRYTYKGKMRVDRKECTAEEEKILVILEELIFYGSGHLQRGRGIQCLPTTLLASDCLLKSLGRSLAARVRLEPAKKRLGDVCTTDWIEEHRRLRIVDWVQALFRDRFRTSDS